MLLKLDQPFSYVVATHIIYYGNLYLVPFFELSKNLKLWFIFTQVGHQIVLRIMDFSIRGTYYLNVSNLKILLILLGIVMFTIFSATQVMYDKTIFSVLFMSIAFFTYIPVLNFLKKDAYN
tara:strand:- start:234 stop:596 length:363 start_codon:yes stop_codon:yes gene_type:complete